MSINSTALLVSLMQSSGSEIDVTLFLDQKLSQEKQKLNSLVKYVEKYPSSCKKRIELADLLYRSGNWQQAIDEYYQVIERQPDRFYLRLKLAKILQLIGKEMEAIELYESALASTQNLAIQQHIQGLIAICQKDIDGAIEAFQSATTLEPQNTCHWLVLGRLQREVGDNQSALQAFETILSQQADDLVALLESYDTLIAMEAFRPAREKLDRLTKLAPHDYQVLKRSIEDRFRLRLVLGMEGKQTKQMIHTALRLAPDSAEIQGLLANYHLLRGENTAGLQGLQRFLHQHPHHPVAWYCYGRCLFEVGNVSEAIEVIRQSFNLFPRNPQIHRLLNNTLREMGGDAVLCA